MCIRDSSGSNGNFIFDDTLYYGGTTTSTECGTAVPASQTFGQDLVKTFICVLQELLIILVVEKIIF